MPPLHRDRTVEAVNAVLVLEVPQKGGKNDEQTTTDDHRNPLPFFRLGWPARQSIIVLLKRFSLLCAACA